jgi:hypothetical protein
MKKSMKKILPILLSVSFLFAGCRKKPAQPQPTPVISDIAETTPAPETPKPTETPAAIAATEAPAEGNA